MTVLGEKKSDKRGVMWRWNWNGRKEWGGQWRRWDWTVGRDGMESEMGIGI
jgi:hypothetical protein